MSGTSVYAENVKMLLRRGGLDLQECYYTWAMVPVYGESQEIVGYGISSGAVKYILRSVPAGFKYLISM